MNTQAETRKTGPAGGARIGGARAWLIWTLGATAFAYAFVQRIAPSVMVHDLMAEFAVGAAVLGNLSAIYLYAYAGLQIPIGIFIDRWGARLMITLALLLAGTGSLVFGWAESLSSAYLGRLFIGIGSAVGFVGTLKLVSRWFQPRQFALLSGLTMTVAMACAVGTQGPLAAVVLASGWRVTLLAGGVTAFALAALIFVIVRDSPGGQVDIAAQRQTWGELGGGLVQVLANRQAWNASILCASFSAIMLSFGGLWGPPYLMARYGLARPEAAFYTSILFLGTAVGAPFIGWFTDMIGRRKSPLIVATLIQLATALYLFLEFPVSPPLIAIPLFILGLTSGGVAACYAYGREVTRPGIEGAVTGMINTFTVGSGALFQPVIGLLLDLNWDGTLEAGTPVYSLAAYKTAFLSLVFVSTVGVVCALMMRETFGKRI